MSRLFVPHLHWFLASFREEMSTGSAGEPQKRVNLNTYDWNRKSEEKHQGKP